MTDAIPSFGTFPGEWILQGQMGELTQYWLCGMPSPHSPGGEPTESHLGSQIASEMGLLVFFI